MRNISFASLLLILLIGNSVVAEEKSAPLDAASATALDDTVNLLNDPKRLEENKKKNQKAQNVDKNLDSLGFSAEQKKEAYRLSSEIFEQIVKETNGDSEKMQKLLSEAMKDPEGFAKRWTPEQRAKLKSLSGEVEKSGKKVKSP